MALLRKQLSSSNFRSSRTSNIQYSRQHSLPPGTITEFVWKDYCSTIFRNIQELGNVRYDDYMVSICRHDILMELAKGGGYCRPFYLAHDQRFVIKTLRKSDAKLLVEMLPSYYAHLKKYEKSLLVKYYGIHAARPGTGGPKVYFVVMENLLQTELHMHRQYDLKGSSQGRNPSRAEGQPRMTLKDPDLDLCFYLEPQTCLQLLKQIQLDCKFLEEQGIMGYSLLLGVHVESQQEVDTDDRVSQASVIAESIKKPVLDEITQAETEEDPSLPNVLRSHTRCPTFSDFLLQTARSDSPRFGSKLRARAIHLPLSGKARCLKGFSNVYLYLGIIDFLRNYNVIRKIEHAYKSLQYDPEAISSVNPKLYATRFQNFLLKVFLPEEFSPQSAQLFFMKQS